MNLASILESRKKAYLLTLGNIDMLRKQLDEQIDKAAQYRGAIDQLEALISLEAKEEDK